MTQLAIEALLKQKTGLDAAVFASDTLTKAVQARMVQCGITERSTYLQQLHQSVQELEALIEAVIVPETWFFRDREPFILLQQIVASDWSRHPGRSLRLLSLPCSTGEEPYSIAIALMEAGLAAHQFHIDAIDISRRSLQRAQQAVYDKHSFRGTDPAFQQRYFTHTPAGYALCEAVRQSVHFHQGNVVDLTFAIDNPTYDIIFCRNLLIYFDRLSRERTLQVLDRLLKAQGWLFVGHAETALLPVAQFTPVRHPFAFAYRKAEPARQARALSTGNPAVNSIPHVVKATTQGITPALTPTPIVARPIDRARPPAPAQPDPTLKLRPVTRPHPPESQTQDGLSTAQVLANQGCLAEAAQQCQTYLNQHPTSADAYVLLGQVYQAMGQEWRAEPCFQKALYLNPKHLEALTHLALLLEQQGDLKRAKTMRQRIQRLI